MQVSIISSSFFFSKPRFYTTRLNVNTVYVVPPSPDRTSLSNGDICICSCSNARNLLKHCHIIWIPFFAGSVLTELRKGAIIWRHSFSRSSLIEPEQNKTNSRSIYFLDMLDALTYNRDNVTISESHNSPNLL